MNIEPSVGVDIRTRTATAAVHQLALTGLRNSIGQHDLDEVPQERDKINALPTHKASQAAPTGR